VSIYRPNSLPFRSGHFGFCPVEDLLKFGNAVAHARVHVSLGTFDVIMQIVAEQLDVGDGRGRHIRVGKVPGEQDECYVANVFRRLESWDTAQFQRRVAIGV
jgi:hypothetical protein